MQSLSDEERKKVLGEVLADELKVIREYVEDVPLIKRKVNDIDKRLTKVEANTKIIKAAITDMSSELKDHERRLTQLEAA
jgi:2-phospho-L-lactate guanylyltransferase (CobY/MobA/RfbA family)